MLVPHKSNGLAEENQGVELDSIVWGRVFCRSSCSETLNGVPKPNDDFNVVAEAEAILRDADALVSA